MICPFCKLRPPMPFALPFSLGMIVASLIWAVTA